MYPHVNTHQLKYIIKESNSLPLMQKRAQPWSRRTIRSCVYRELDYQRSHTFITRRRPYQRSHTPSSPVDALSVSSARKRRVLWPSSDHSAGGGRSAGVCWSSFGMMVYNALRQKEHIMIAKTTLKNPSPWLGTPKAGDITEARMFAVFKSMRVSTSTGLVFQAEATHSLKSPMAASRTCM